LVILFALIGAIICATASSVKVVIIGMTFAGVGAANQQMALAVLSEIYPNKWRGYIQRMLLSILVTVSILITGCCDLGLLEVAPLPFSACGSLIAHTMAQNATWRWVYYLNIILSASAMIIMAVFYFPVSLSLDGPIFFWLTELQ
jgi:MFS family permease